MPGVNSEAVEVVNRMGSGMALILCEHASNHIPERYKGLGLRAADRESHAAWDPGARSMAAHLAGALSAPLVASRVSRLVYDCNRPFDAPTAVPERSERVAVPGNVGLSDEQRTERYDTVYRPFADTVSRLLEERRTAARTTVLITVHSFVPVYFGKQRDVEIGILHDADDRLANAMLSAAATVLPHRRIRRNDPYGPDDGVTHSLKEHGIRHGLLNVMIETRNDLLRTADQQAAMARELLSLLHTALDGIGIVTAQHA